ncbi:hypothetical protein D3C73_1669400 [compost metagenome]
MPLSKQYLTIGGYRYGLSQIEDLKQLLRLAEEDRLAEVGSRIMEFDVDAERMKLRELLRSIELSDG